MSDGDRRLWPSQLKPLANTSQRLGAELQDVRIVESLGMGGEAFLFHAKPAANPAGPSLVLKVAQTQADAAEAERIRLVRAERARRLVGLKLSQLPGLSQGWFEGAPYANFKSQFVIPRRIGGTPSTELADVEGSVAKLVEGTTLRDLVDDGFEASIGERRAWCEHLACAVHLMEQAGLVHGDLSPGNVLLQAGERPTIRLIDFDGYYLPKLKPLPVSSSVGGRTWGTPGYRSAYFRDDRERKLVTTDRVSLGLLLIEIATRRASDPHGDSLLDQAQIDDNQWIVDEQTEARWPAGWALLKRALDARPHPSELTWDSAPSPLDWLVALRHLRDSASIVDVEDVEPVSLPPDSDARHHQVQLSEGDSTVSYWLPRDAAALRAATRQVPIKITKTWLWDLDDKPEYQRVTEELHAAGIERFQVLHDPSLAPGQVRTDVKATGRSQ